MQETFYTVPGCPVLIAQVSDLHERPYDGVLASLRRNRPDLICITGDFFFGRPVQTGFKAEAAGVLPFFSACASLAPCFVSLGNHEWMIQPEDFALINGTGAKLLDNAFVSCRMAAAKLVIGGLTSGRVTACDRLQRASFSLLDANRYTRKAKSVPLLTWLDAYCAAPGYHILLCHHPEYYPRYLKGRDIPLILSGHAHGGQVRLLGQGLFAPDQGILPRLTSGVKDGRLVISRGLANHKFVPRLFNPTEIVYVSGGQPESQAKNDKQQFFA